jgi:hypothetical protein
MIAAIQAHVRRTCDLLEWITSTKSTAACRWRGERVGNWIDLKPDWQVSAGRIRLRFSIAGRSFVLWVSSVQRRPDSAAVRLLIPGRPLPETLDVSWTAPATEDAISRRGFCRELVKWAEGVLPGSFVESVERRSDRAHTISGSFLRLRLRYKGGAILVLAVPENLAADHSQSALTQALLWSLVLRRDGGQPPSQIRIIAPSAGSAILHHRSQYIETSRAVVEIGQYERKASGELVIAPAPAPLPPTEDRDFRWPVLGPFRWSAILGKVFDLAPGLIRRYPRFQDYDSLRLWGLEFARVEGPQRDRILFGIGEQKTELTLENFSCLCDLVNEILYFRRPDSPMPRHPYYRLQAERWLEALILENVPGLFPELIPETIYPQIPVYLGNAPGRVEILGVDAERQLVVMELKVVPDPDLPLQALDYWGRVIHHSQQGDFVRRGYFSGIAVDQRAPKIYLVSPVFSFHDSTERLLSFMNPKVDVWKIGINEDWRSGVKILRRIRIRCGAGDSAGGRA